MPPITINRTPWNALIDDSGQNLDGSLWDKAAIAGVLLDPIDQALAKIPVDGATGKIPDTALSANVALLNRSGQIFSAQNSFTGQLVASGLNFYCGVSTPAYFDDGIIVRNQTQVNLANAGQIVFPATQWPSTDPNTFDDYEEGTWTPGILFGGAAVGMVYNERAGWYIKIGGWIWAGLRIILGSKGTSVGSATITGLPFADRDGGNVGGNFNYFGAMNAGVANMPSMYITNATITPALGAAGGIIIMDNTSFNPGSLIGAVMYRTPT